MRAFAAATCLGTLLAQAPPAAPHQIASQLASDQPLSVAQGAHEAGQRRDKQLGKPLLQALAKWRGSSDEHASLADAVVRAREQQQVFVDMLRRELVEKRALTPSEAEPLDYRVVARISDDRRERKLAVSAIPAAK